MERDNKNGNTKVVEKDTKAQNVSIDDRLEEIASNIRTLDEWKRYIADYYPVFCGLLAKLEVNAGGTLEESNKKPIAVILGGQPGAGKSALIATYKTILKDGYGIDAGINNADFYRFSVPGSYRVATDFPESASEVTDPVVKMMRRNLMEESIAQKKSVIIENTLGDTIVVDKMRQGGVHDIWLALMAVPREESLLSDFERYIKMQETADIARLVSVEAHDKRYRALDKIVSELENTDMRILVHSRGKTENDFVTLEYDSKNPDKRYSSALDAIGKIRKRTFKEGVHGYGDRLKNIRQKMESLGMTPDEEIELHTLEDIITKSIAKEMEGEER